ncbi:hypothetical protein AU195_14045 [Mycobacterium sp. IS-1496]|uniref:sensor domain-containing protein n=1 Tax=Mycobacterium sp. IS-1496 TaxID=1772284 RepID=UPI0007417D6F|nr:sensor domain-containing protein [Mycobacterium sp. IS-1496]KUI26096.1 hypothetical protein AU195_14045 [Mycobacterium sp. IS-1496]
MFVNRSVVLFPSADQAKQFVTKSAEAWKACGGDNVTVTTEDGTAYTWTFDRVDQTDTQISQRVTQEGMEGYGCEHVLRVASNALPEVAACRDNVTDDGTRMVDAMAAKLPA